MSEGPFKKEYKRKIKTLEERFWLKVNKTKSCWPWTAYLKDGYGRLFTENGKSPVEAHRFSYELHSGKIPGGFVIDHICKNPSCVNPRHLRAVTKRINSIENSISVSAVNAQKTHCLRGHEFNEGNTIARKTRFGHPARACRRCYGEVFIPRRKEKLALAKYFPEKKEGGE